MSTTSPPPAATEPATHQVVLGITGMHCAGCVSRVESALESVAGVSHAEVNLALERAWVKGVRSGLEPDLVNALTEAGFGTEPAAAQVGGAPETTGNSTAERSWVAFALVLTLPLVLPMVGALFGVSWRLAPVAELVLAGAVQFLAGARFYRSALDSLRRRAPGMDLLVVIGTTVAYAYSAAVVAGLTEGHLYFETSAVIISLVLLGKWLEARARHGASAAIRGLMALHPEVATLEHGGAITVVPTDRVRPGDTVLVRPGERIPVDGELLEGEASVDESLITGESLAVTRGPGDPLTGGAINLDGHLRLRCTARGDEGRLARIIALVEEAQMRKAPVQRLVDRVAGIFVPVVLVIALLTFAGWLGTGAGLEQALVASVAVLVIACPCALGLATPTALVAGTGAAARHGILIRDAQALERAARCTAVAFDKTGTLTRGEPEVVVAPGATNDRRDALALAASLQQASEHPLARALVAYARAAGLSLRAVSDFRNHAGAGVTGRVAGHQVAVGSVALMSRLGVTLPANDVDEARSHAHLTWSHVAVDGAHAGRIGFADAVREEAADAVSALRRRGLEVWLLTGDNPAAAQTVATQTGIARWQASMTPEEKAARIRELGEGDRRIAMVGDGINDAPALAAADLGMAMGEGTDVAMESAGVTLLRSDPRLVAATLAVSTATLRTIRQNLFWAFAYNVIGIPVAALGFLNPAVAGAAMALSSVCVVTNALRLRRWQSGTGETR